MSGPYDKGGGPKNKARSPRLAYMRSLLSVFESLYIYERPYNRERVRVKLCLCSDDDDDDVRVRAVRALSREFFNLTIASLCQYPAVSYCKTKVEEIGTDKGISRRRAAIQSYVTRSAFAAQDNAILIYIRKKLLFSIII